jgi:hypothetical protein
MTEAKITDFARDTFRVGPFTVTMSLVNGQLNTKWEPFFPTKKLSRKEMAQYRAGRDRFLAQAAPGQSLLVIEV